MRNNQQCSTFHFSLHCLTNDRLSSFSIFSEVIFQSIKSLDPNKAHGQDEISLKMLKLCASSVRKPLLWFLRAALRLEKNTEQCLYCQFAENYGKNLCSNQLSILLILYKWVKVFKNGPNEICGRQALKNLKEYGLL